MYTFGVCAVDLVGASSCSKVMITIGPASSGGGGMGGTSTSTIVGTWVVALSQGCTGSPAEYTFGAGICVEPANHEFLTVNTGPTAPRKDNEIQYNDIEVARKNANKPEAMERIQRINTPILIFGRETDHQQGIFKLTYEWMKEAGKDVEWQSFDHPTHGYVFIYNQPDGSYKPDPTQAKTFHLVVAYFDKIAQDLYPVVHHSAAFRDAYHPAYRVVAVDLLAST